MGKSGVLYTNPENLRSNKILIAAKYSGANVKIDDKFVLGETNKTADYLAKFPSGAVPAFKSNDDKFLSESNAIAYYLSNDQLRGKNEYETAQVLQWVHFADAEITPPLATWAFDKMGIKKENAKEIERAKAALNHSLAVLDDFLRTRTYLVGEYVTLADIACYCTLFLGFQQKLFDGDHVKKFVNVHRWYNTCVNQPQAKAVLVGESEKKETPKKAAPAAAEEEPPKKPTDPFVLLPAGSFIMDEWKRTFSNNDFSEVALPYFLEKFDKENYSIWFAEYKYPEDLTHVFMTCNLVAGMFQRLDRMRKHSFGVMSIFGVKNDNTITGVFMWRGQGLAFELSEDLQVDYDSYSWRKVDADSDEAKKLVADYWSRKNDIEFKGKKFNQAFVWK